MRYVWERRIFISSPERKQRITKNGQALGYCDHACLGFVVGVIAGPFDYG
jgi:hypothetical protein